MLAVTVSYGRVRGKARNYPYFQPAIYKATRLKNGKIVWAYQYHLGRARRSPKLAAQDADAAVGTFNEPSVRLFGVRHLTPVSPEQFLGE